MIYLETSEAELIQETQQAVQSENPIVQEVAAVKKGRKGKKK